MNSRKRLCRKPFITGKYILMALLEIEIEHEMKLNRETRSRVCVYCRRNGSKQWSGGLLQSSRKVQHVIA